MLTTAIATVTVAFGVVMLAAFAWTLRENVRRGQLVRTRLGVRMADLPLSQLLPRYGYLPRQFLYETSLNRVENMLRMCEQCEAVGQCKAALERGDSPEAFVFCPNRGALRPRD